MGPGVKAGWNRKYVQSLYPSDSLGKIFLPVPTTLSFADLEMLASYWGALLPGATANLQLSWKPRIPLATMDFY